MEWTRVERYRRFESAPIEEIKALEARVAACPDRQTFHVQPNSGLLNDPNGFSYFNGEYHLFYQWFGLGPVHGVKYWYHLSSTDMVNWEDCGIGLSPDCDMDSHGVFSGSGFVKDDELYLMYTGNTRDENWIRHPYQCLAIMNKDGEIKKVTPPVIKDVPAEYTDNFRDPKVFKQGDLYYCVIGAEMKVGRGAIAYYSSPDLYNWTYGGNLNLAFKGTGSVWECPDYLELNDRGVIIVSEQVFAENNDFFSNVLIGDKLNFQDGNFTHKTVARLDYGFEFYAPQTMQDDKGRHLLSAWMGLPDMECETDETGWAHCLSLPRELRVENDRLIQTPIVEMQSLRQNARHICTTLEGVQQFNGFSGRTYELHVTFAQLIQNVGLKLRTSETEQTLFYYDAFAKQLVLDRSESGRTETFKHLISSRVDFEATQLKLQIFVDVSSVEIFVNDGELVFTSRIFTKSESTGINFFADAKTEFETTIYDLKAATVTK